MSDVDDSYLSGYLGGYEGIPYELANRIYAWFVSYINQNVGVDLGSDTSEVDDDLLNSYFSDYSNVQAYVAAMMASDWYAEYEDWLADWDGSVDDDDSGIEDDSDTFPSIIGDDLPVSTALAEQIYAWVGDYLQANAGVNVFDGVDNTEAVELSNYFSSGANIQNFADALMATDWFVKWEAVYNKAAAEGSVDDDAFIFSDYLDDDDVEILDDDGNLWDSQIKRADGEVVAAEEAQLYRAYAGAMGRTPDEAGYLWWLGEIEAGRHDLNSMAGGFIHSSEFKGLADTNGNDVIDNAEFVMHMYEGVFERAPDQAGFDYWVGELESGQRSQSQVFIDMTQSDEYVQKTYLTVADMLFI